MCFLRQCCTHCLCPTLWPQCSKTGSVLAMQPLCRSHGWTVVNHYYTKLGSNHVFFAAMLHSLFVPHIVGPKTGSVLAMQPLCRSHDWTVVNHYCTQNWGLTMCAAMLHSLCAPQCLCPTCVNHYCTGVSAWPKAGHNAPKLARSWPCSLCAEVMVGCGKSLLHTKLGSHHVFFAAMLHSLFVPHIVNNAVARSWPCSLCAEVMVGLW